MSSVFPGCTVSLCYKQVNMGVKHIKEREGILWDF